MTPSLGVVLRQAREVRELLAVEAARAAGISAAYLGKLENDVVKKPSPLVLDALSQALSLPYGELMRLSGYRVPDQAEAMANVSLGAAFFADLTDDECAELLDYLAWYRGRRRPSRGGDRGG
jgi:transcriptional regulator with XRE-family HTH domain